MNMYIKNAPPSGSAFFCIRLRRKTWPNAKIKLFLSEISLDVTLLKNVLSLEDVSTGLL